MKNRFYFFTELSSQSRRPGLPPGFPEHGSASRVSSATASESSLPPSRNRVADFPRGLFYQTTSNEYRPIDANFRGLVTIGHNIIGRNDNGILRAIFNQWQQMILVDTQTDRQYVISSELAVELGINRPIPREDLNRARIEHRRRILRIRNNDIRK